MKPPPFVYARPESVDEALGLLADAGGDTRVLAGGQSLVPLMAFRRARPDLLVDVNEIPDLDRFERDEAGGLAIGATCRQHSLERALPQDPRWHALTAGMRQMGNYATRNRGTVGGSIAHADPAGELPLLFVLYDGELTARSPGVTRVVRASELFLGPHGTALRRDELVTEVRLPAPPDGMVTGFAELNERTAVASVAIGLVAREGRCEWCRIALGGVAPTPIRAREAEAVLSGSRLTGVTIDEAARAAAGGCAPQSDLHGSARFRRALVEAFVGRVARRLASDAAS